MATVTKASCEEPYVVSYSCSSPYLSSCLHPNPVFHVATTGTLKNHFDHVILQGAVQISLCGLWGDFCLLEPHRFISSPRFFPLLYCTHTQVGFLWLWVFLHAGISVWGALSLPFQCHWRLINPHCSIRIQLRQMSSREPLGTSPVPQVCRT